MRGEVRFEDGRIILVIKKYKWEKLDLLKNIETNIFNKKVKFGGGVNAC